MSNANNFKYLDEMIHSGAKEIVLDADVIFNDGNEYFNGIAIDVDNLVIDANGHVIDAADNARIFEVSAKNVLIKNAVLKNANVEGDGGAINNLENGKLRISHVNFIDNVSNYGGAVFNDGIMEIEDSNFIANHAISGGAIVNASQLHVGNASFDNNAADTAGAIDNWHSIRINDSSFKENSSKNGGSIVNDGKMDLEGVVFERNSAENGSVIDNQENGNFRIDKSEFIGNTANAAEGMIANHGKFRMSDSRFEHNQCTFGPIINNLKCDMKIQDVEFVDNIPGKDYFSLSSSKDGNLKTSGITYKNAFIPDGQNYDLSYLNELIEGGLREIGLESDIEVSDETCLVVDVDNVLIDGNGHHINVRKKDQWNDNHKEVFSIDARNVIIKNITVENNFGTVLWVKSDASLEIVNSTFLNNKMDYYEGWGAVIYSDGQIKIVSCIFDNNGYMNADSSGGAIGNFGKMVIKNSLFCNNRAGWGGAINNYDELIVIGSKFEGNESGRSGGAIYNHEELKISNSNFINNQSAQWLNGSGNAIYNGDGHLLVDKTTFDDWYSVFSNPYENTILNDNCILRYNCHDELPYSRN